MPICYLCCSLHIFPGKSFVLHFAYYSGYMILNMDMSGSHFVFLYWYQLSKFLLWFWLQDSQFLRVHSKSPTRSTGFVLYIKCKIPVSAVQHTYTFTTISFSFSISKRAIKFTVHSLLNHWDMFSVYYVDH